MEPSADPTSSTAGLTTQLQAVATLLETVAANRTLLDRLSIQDRTRLLKAAGDLYCPDPVERRRLTKLRVRQRKAARIEHDRSRLDETGIRTLRRKPVFTTPNVFPPADFEPDNDPVDSGRRDVLEPQNCYICKQDYTTLHAFYDQLCPPCAALNFRKRTELADLRGRVALLTGGRVKIGYQAGLKLLRSGVHLIVSTRFPRDAARRYAAEPDFAAWGHRLEIFGLDLRHTPSVEAFCQHLTATRSRLDFLVNNACQTVRRPPGFYRHMIELETAARYDLPGSARRLLEDYEGWHSRHPDLENGAVAITGQLPELAGLTHAAALSQVPLLPDDLAAPEERFPREHLDADLQQVDLRELNSWRLRLAEVQSVELLEVHLVNAIAPFILNARLKSLFLRTPDRDKHIVNVSAVEGQFYRKFKTTRHPHTNMAKAALNMMTRTAAADYHADGIHMNSVDTGWVTDEDPAAIAARKISEHRFHPPLDIVDGAARITDPIIAGFNSRQHLWGKFLKDYQPTDW